MNMNAQLKEIGAKVDDVSSKLDNTSNKKTVILNKSSGGNVLVDVFLLLCFLILIWWFVGYGPKLGVSGASTAIDSHKALTADTPPPFDLASPTVCRIIARNGTEFITPCLLPEPNVFDRYVASYISLFIIQNTVNTNDEAIKCFDGGLFLVTDLSEVLCVFPVKVNKNTVTYYELTYGPYVARTTTDNRQRWLSFDNAETSFFKLQLLPGTQTILQYQRYDAIFNDEPMPCTQVSISFKNAYYIAYQGTTVFPCDVTQPGPHNSQINPMYLYRTETTDVTNAFFNSADINDTCNEAMQATCYTSYFVAHTTNMFYYLALGIRIYGYNIATTTATTQPEAHRFIHGCLSVAGVPYITSYPSTTLNCAKVYTVSVSGGTQAYVVNTIPDNRWAAFPERGCFLIPTGVPSLSFVSGSALIVQSHQICLTGSVGGPVNCFVDSPQFYLDLFKNVVPRPGIANQGYSAVSVWGSSFYVASALPPQPCSVASSYFLDPYLFGYGFSNQGDLAASYCCSLVTSATLYGYSGVLSDSGVSVSVALAASTSSKIPGFRFLNRLPVTDYVGISYVNGTYNYVLLPTIGTNNTACGNSKRCLGSFCYSTIFNCWYVYKFTTFLAAELTSLPTLAPLGNYRQGVMQPYFTLGIDSIYSVLRREAVSITRCSSYYSCIALEPSVYLIRYSFGSTTRDIGGQQRDIFIPTAPPTLPYSRLLTLDSDVFSSASVYSSFVTVNIKDDRNDCLFGNMVSVDGFCYEFVTDIETVVSLDEYLLVNLPIPSAGYTTRLGLINGYYDQTVLFKPLENGTSSIPLGFLDDLFYIPRPIVEVTRNTKYPLVTLVRAAGVFDITYVCRSKTRFLTIDTRITNSMEIPCSANTISYFITTHPVQFKYSGVIYRNVQFSTFDDAISWKENNPTLFWFVIAFVLCLLPLFVWLLFAYFIPILTFLVMLVLRFAMLFLWLFRVFTLRFTPSIGRFWSAIAVADAGTGFLGWKPDGSALQFRRPRLPRLRYLTPYALLSPPMHWLATRTLLQLVIMIVFLPLIFAKPPEQTVAHVSKRTVSFVEVTNETPQQVRLDSTNRFGDLYAFTYTILNPQGVTGTAVIEFSDNVGPQQMITYRPSSTDSQTVLQKPIVVRFYNTFMQFSTSYMYTTGPSVTAFQSSCVYFSNLCDNSPMTNRLPCNVFETHEYSIPKDGCCPTASQTKMHAASCLDPKQQQDYVSCYQVQAAQPVLNFTVEVDGVEHVAQSTGSVFTAGSCTGSATIVLTKQVALETICCNRLTCKTCSVPPTGQNAEYGHFGDIQQRGSSSYASPVAGIYRNTHCLFSRSCYSGCFEHSGYKQFDSKAICNDDIPSLYNCLNVRNVYISEDQEDLHLENCNFHLDLKLQCNASVVPVVHTPLVSDLTISCQQGNYGYKAGLICNYTIVNGGDSSCVIAPVGYINDLVSPEISVSDVVAPPLTTVTCAGCVVISSNVKTITFSLSIPGTTVSTSKTVTLQPPAQYMPIAPGAQHSVVNVHCSYTQKLKNAWSNVGKWMGANLGFFIPYFVVVFIIFVLYFLLLWYNRASACGLFIYIIILIIISLLIGLIGPAVMAVPGCD